MTAKESVRDFPSSLRECANFSKKSIEHICKKIGGRGCTSPEERKAQEYMAGQMRKYADEVKIEDFKVAPYAFMGWVLIDVVLALAATALHWFPEIPGQKIISLGLFSVAILLMLLEFLFYKRALDVFMPKKTSCNVVGRYKPEGEIKRRIIFSGHADSAMEWHFSYWGGPPLLIGSIVAAFGGFVVNFVMGILLVVNQYMSNGFMSDGAVNAIRIILTCFVPFYIFCFWFCSWGKFVHGANDNLTGCYGAISVLKFLSDNKIRFKNTEVVALTTGGEEEGLRGAKAFCEAHKDECLSVDTVFIGLETFRDYDHFAIYKRDMTNTVANSMIASALIKRGAKNAGRDLPYANVPFGSSDAAAVSQAGIHATCMAGQDPAPLKYYHTREDTSDNMIFKSIEFGINAAIETAFVFDEFGMNVPD